MSTKSKRKTSSENGVQQQQQQQQSHINNNKKMSKTLLTEEAATAAAANNNYVTAEYVVSLPSAVLNKLYHSYSTKQRRSGLKWFVFSTTLFNLWSTIMAHGQPLDIFSITLFALSANVSIFVLMNVKITLFIIHYSSALKHRFRFLIEYAPHLLWTLCIVHTVLYIYLQFTASPRDVLGWAILLNFLIYVTLPVELLFTGCLIGFTTFFSYLGVLVLSTRHDPLFWEQIIANGILTFAAALIGLLYYFMGEAKQKRAFLEAKKSIEVKMTIEEESAEQERLLLSVLPKHVAVRMRQDLGSTNSEPFKKIYMSRHENVSILYADIVGFTAISSTYSAQDLVKMLNELFARFDRLAEKYRQLRIKILGDCYYCISGAPDERSDHAVLCVHMGLSMVKAIKYVQQKTNSPVDMRVGIHTGAILAGILGQRQWQFDIYSKDVELANKMESSGKAGFVHISDKTLCFLNDEFEVEPAYGEKREEALRIAGLKTYFITKVLKPFTSPSAKQINELENANNDQETLDEELLPVDDEQERDIDAEILEKQEIFKQRLQEELVARNGHEDLAIATTFFLKFKDKSLEDAYAEYREPYSSLPLLAALLVQSVDIFYSYIVLPRSPLHFINISAPLVPLVMLVFISIAESFPKYLPDFFVSVSKRFNDIHFVRELAAIIIVITIGLSNVIDMFFFVYFLKTEHIVSESEFNTTTEDLILAEPLNDPIDQTEVKTVIYPSYMSNFGILILIAVSVIAQLTHVTKIVLMLTITVLHCYCNAYVLTDLYSLEDSLAFEPIIPTHFCASSMIVIAGLALSCLARYMDMTDRVIFKWKSEVAEQKEMATDMRQRNEALVYNVLPKHVAEHFIKKSQRSYDDLYSQSYDEVGVLFASMPNFSDFYSEETVNNQGLECLRFLNEVISDFDALLELPQFQDVIKIKTIGSTYMAASGINTHRIINADDPITKRWAHLDVLVQFALELKKALQGINEQSFNHFVLKMGVNHGPITAGVIGARKPHYDIWGNTVNVASRMESTGKAGAIQVTEETHNILQEFGYTFLQRGLVSVKGKGQLMTYYLQGKSTETENIIKSCKNGTKSPVLITNINHNNIVAEEMVNNLENNILEQENYNNNKMNEGGIKMNDEFDVIDIKTPLLDIKTNGTILETKMLIDIEKDAIIA